QLLSRPECLGAWGDDPHRRELAQTLCQALARAKKWPNDRFIPDDPFEIAFFEPSGVDGFEVLEVANALTRITGRKVHLQDLALRAKDHRLVLADLLHVAG